MEQQLRDKFIAKHDFIGLPIAEQINKQRLNLKPKFLMKYINKPDKIQKFAEELTDSLIQQEKFIDAIEQEQQLISTNNNNNNNCGTKRSFNTMNQHQIVHFKNIQNPPKKQRLIADINSNNTKIPNTNKKSQSKSNEINIETIYNIINKMKNKKGVIVAANDKDCNKIYSNLCLIYNNKTTNQLSKWIEDKNNKYKILITTIQMG
eukprot:486301_1